jgi:hypothetical protein
VKIDLFLFFGTSKTQQQNLSFNCDRVVLAERPVCNDVDCSCARVILEAITGNQEPDPSACSNPSLVCLCERIIIVHRDCENAAKNQMTETAVPQLLSTEKSMGKKCAIKMQRLISD